MTKREVLADLGLSKNETEVYLKLLELRTATAVEVSKSTRLHRPNVYDALNRLTKKGLVAHFMQEKTKFFEVVDPEQLMNLLKAKEADLQKILPELKIMQFEAKPPSSIAIFEGIAGARKVWIDAISNTKELYVLGAPKDLVNVLGPGWIKEWHKIREKRKIMFYHIVNEDYYPERIKLIRNMKYIKLKFLPKEYSSPNALLINDNGIVMTFLNPLVAIKIYKPELAKSFRRYYQMLDKIALKKAPQEK